MGKWTKLFAVLGLAVTFLVGGLMVGCKKEEAPLETPEAPEAPEVPEVPEIPTE